jgi:hypothetical protein
MLGLYGPIKQLLGVTGANQNIAKKFLAGGYAGAIGALIGSPLVLIRTRIVANKNGNMAYG